MIFYRSELLYDCKNCAYVEGDVMKTDDEHARHQLYDICEDGNVDRVTRVLDLAIAQCVEACYPYTKLAVDEHTEMDDVLTTTQAYVVEMTVPDDFSRTTVTLIERMIHELLVCRVLFDWLSIVNPDKAPIWEDKAKKAEEELKSSLNARLGRVRKTQTPF